MTIYHEDKPETKQRWGARFKSAREEMNLTDKEVAIRLHLKPHMVVAIENETIGKVVPAIFARGYIRSYGHFVNFSEKEIEQALIQLDLAPPPSALVQAKNSRKKTPNASSHSGWATFLVISVLAGLVGTWWNMHLRINHNATPNAIAAIPHPEQPNQTPTLVETTPAPAAPAPAANSDPLPPELAHASLPAPTENPSAPEANQPAAPKSASKAVASQTTETEESETSDATQKLTDNVSPEPMDKPDNRLSTNSDQKEPTLSKNEESVNDESETAADPATESLDNNVTANN